MQILKHQYLKFMFRLQIQYKTSWKKSFQKIDQDQVLFFPRISVLQKQDFIFLLLQNSSGKTFPVRDKRLERALAVIDNNSYWSYPGGGRGVQGLFPILAHWDSWHMPN